ncbi:conserved hypothetical protein [Beggiatoa sp. PS]|nr:conserved hypothetical protein [Beggiatoa sp. PS]
MMHFPIVIHKDSDSDYGVTVPDLPGCFSAGATLDEVLAYAQESILCHLEGMLMDGETIPLPKTIEEHHQNPDYLDGIWALISIAPSKISRQSKSIQITLPEKIIFQLDKYAEQQGETRSSLLAQAAVEYISTHQSKINF